MRYIETLLTEKGIDLEDFTWVESGEVFGDIQIQSIVNFIYDSGQAEKCKSILRKIDYKNGDVMHFLNFVGTSMAQIKAKEMALWG